MGGEDDVDANTYSERKKGVSKIDGITREREEKKLGGIVGQIHSELSVAAESTNVLRFPQSGLIPEQPYERHQR